MVISLPIRIQLTGKKSYLSPDSFFKIGTNRLLTAGWIHKEMNQAPHAR